MSKPRKPLPDSKTCYKCQLVFKPSSRSRFCSRCRQKLRRTPCPTCGSPKSPKAIHCDKCYPRGGTLNPRWKGGKTRDAKGYVYIRKNNKYIAEHVLVMEQLLGRPLVDQENVHHLNGIRDDNRSENLELWTRPQPSGIRAEDALSWALDIIRLYKPDLLK